MSHFRVRWKLIGHHVHARVFVASIEAGGFAMSGALVFHEVEWRAFLRCFDGGDLDTVSFIPEENQP
jgi:hypothetical protein